MNIDFAFICDYADVTTKLNALGIGFDTIYTAKVPTKHPLFFLVIQLRAHSVEAGEKELQVSIIDEDGAEVLTPIKGKMGIPKPVRGTESIGRIAINFTNVEFKRYCSYSIHAVIEGHEMVRIPFRVSPPASKPPATGQQQTP